jgi:hypothetical protein
LVAKVPVTPAGSPERERFTLPVKPNEFTPTAVAAEPPSPRLTLVGLTMTKGASTVRLKVAEAVTDPEAPLRVAVTVPEGALAAAVRVSVLEPFVGLGEKEAVTPLGSPETDRLTLPVNPYCGVTRTVVVAGLLRLTETALGVAVRRKVGA